MDLTCQRASLSVISTAHVQLTCSPWAQPKCLDTSWAESRGLLYARCRSSPEDSEDTPSLRADTFKQLTLPVSLGVVLPPRGHLARTGVVRLLASSGCR